MTNTVPLVAQGVDRLPELQVDRVFDLLPKVAALPDSSCDVRQRPDLVIHPHQEGSSYRFLEGPLRFYSYACGHGKHASKHAVAYVHRPDEDLVRVWVDGQWESVTDVRTAYWVMEAVKKAEAEVSRRGNRNSTLAMTLEHHFTTL